MTEEYTFKGIRAEPSSVFASRARTYDLYRRTNFFGCIHPPADEKGGKGSSPVSGCVFDTEKEEP